MVALLDGSTEAARKAAELSPDDRAELGRFADFLRTKDHVEED